MKNLAQASLQRRAAIQQFINDAIQHVCHDAPSPRQATIGSLLESLLAFGEKQLNFFEGIYGTPLGPQLTKSYPQTYVINSILEQIGFDLDVILRAYSQRRLDLTANSLGSTAGRNLRMADLWTYSALAPVMRGLAVDDNVLVGESTVLTYFQKAPYVRLIPYAPVVLIGIPFTAIGNSFDLMAIPHEVGHYVYHRGVYEGQALGQWLGKRLKNKIPAWGMRWIEETFADVYGCLVAGTHIADSAVELARRASLAEFFDDNGEHPIPALRPLIYITVLEQLGGRYADHAAYLRSQWAAVLQERQPSALASTEVKPLRVLIENEQRSYLSARDPGVIEDVLRKIVTEVLSLPPLQALLLQSSADDNDLWGRQAVSLDDLTARLWQQKGSFIDPELEINAQRHLCIRINGQETITGDAIGLTPWDELRDAVEQLRWQSDPEPEEVEETFTQALHFNGWAVKVVGGGKAHIRITVGGNRANLTAIARGGAAHLKPAVGGGKAHLKPSVGGGKAHLKPVARGAAAKPKPAVGGGKAHLKPGVGGGKAHLTHKK